MGAFDEVCHQRLCGIVSVITIVFGHGVQQEAILMNWMFLNMKYLHKTYYTIAIQTEIIKYLYTALLKHNYHIISHFAEQEQSVFSLFKRLLPVLNFH